MGLWMDLGLGSLGARLLVRDWVGCTCGQLARTLWGHLAQDGVGWLLGLGAHCANCWRLGALQGWEQFLQGQWKAHALCCLGEAKQCCTGGVSRAPVEPHASQDLSSPGKQPTSSVDDSREKPRSTAVLPMMPPPAEKDENMSSMTHDKQQDTAAHITACPPCPSANSSSYLHGGLR